MAKLDMNPEIREQWCKALRSGEYTQAKENLRVRNEDGSYSHCCLGVLTDLYVKAGNPTEFRLDGLSEVFPLWEDGTLPEPVMKWAGIDNCNPVLQDSDPAAQYFDQHCAAEWNDEYGADFQKIADMIDGGPAKQG